MLYHSFHPPSSQPVAYKYPDCSLHMLSHAMESFPPYPSSCLGSLLAVRAILGAALVVVLLGALVLFVVGPIVLAAQP